MNTLKERFEEAFYGLLEAGDNLNRISNKLNEAEKLIRKNKEKQEVIKEILTEIEVI